MELFLTRTLTQVLDVPFLPTILRSKLPSMHLQSAFSTTEIFHIASILTRSPFHCQWRETVGSYSWNSLVLACSPLSGGIWLDRIVGWLPHNVGKEEESWRAEDPRVPLRTTTSCDISVSFPVAVPCGGWKHLGFRLKDGWLICDLPASLLDFYFSKCRVWVHCKSFTH